MTFKPAGYPSLAPYLIVTDAEAAMCFAESCFDAIRLRVIERDGGGIMHAEIRIDDTVLMIGEMPQGSGAHLHLYVSDPQAVMARAVAAGGTVVQELQDQNDGDLRGGVSDAQGTTWWIARQIGEA